MAKIALVTDSTSSIPAPLLQQYPIHVLPQTLVWGDEMLRDGIDIQPDAFYSRLATAKTMPTTSQASPNDFQKKYRQLLEEGFEILTVVVSSGLSGTLNSALQAQGQFSGAPLEVVDSYTTAMALGFLVLEAARAAQRGASLAECKALVEAHREHTGVVFAVDTLEFLHRGGRIGGGSRLLGTALNIKPILEMRGGKVDAVERVRTRRKSLERLVELVEERAGGRKPVHLATLHANAPIEAKELLAEAERRLGACESVFSEVSPVVGTHTGPGTVGLAFLAGW